MWQQAAASSFLVSSDPFVQEAAVRLFWFWGCAVTYFGMLAMVSPLVLKSIVGADVAAIWQGRLTSITAFSGLVLCAALGFASDKWGRLRFVKIWSAFFFLSSLGLLYAEVSKSLNGLIFSRLVPFSVASSSLIPALASDIARSSGEVLKAHAGIGSTFSAAMLVGNTAAGLFEVFFSRRYVLSLGVATLGVAVYLAFYRLRGGGGGGGGGDGGSGNGDGHRRSHDDGDHHDGNSEEYPGGDAADGNTRNISSSPSSWMAALTLLFKDPLLRLLVLAYALLRCANVNTFILFVLFVNVKFQWHLPNVSAFLFVLGLIGALTQVWFVRFINNTSNNHLSGGQQRVLRLFFGLLALAPFVCAAKGFVSEGYQMYLLTIPAGVTMILPAIFTSKIASLSREDGLAGFSLGLVGSLQNLIETFLGVAFGQLLHFSIQTFEPSSMMFGLPYYVNSLCYVLVLAIVLYAHRVHGKDRAVWMQQSVAFVGAAAGGVAGAQEETSSTNNKCVVVDEETAAIVEDATGEV